MHYRSWEGKNTAHSKGGALKPIYYETTIGAAKRKIYHGKKLKGERAH